MLNNFWNSIESSVYRNAIIVTIVLTIVAVIFIFLMRFLFKSNKSKKKQ
jgi:hypothetical protein